ncbi:hypothetical protein AAGO69_28095, partial [Klebsiella pneumoniae]
GESSGDLHNVIAGRRRTRFLNVLKTVFPAAPATLHGHAINCVPVHRFQSGLVRVLSCLA